jgi:hypothetical protein
LSRNVRGRDLSGRTPSPGDIAATLLQAPLPAGAADPSPFRDQTPAPEQIRRDIEAVEPVHVLGWVYAMQKDGVHDRESESRQSIGQDTVPRKSRGTVTRAYLRAATPGLIAQLSQPPAEC